MLRCLLHCGREKSILHQIDFCNQAVRAAADIVGIAVFKDEGPAAAELNVQLFGIGGIEYAVTLLVRLNESLFVFRNLVIIILISHVDRADL